jgi:protocatechuate 3,4-dioxygenase beta subunit
VNYITGKVLDSEGNPAPDVSVKITWDGGEYTVKTDDEGVYRKDDVEPGKYKVTVDADGYEEIEEEVTIG